MMVEHAEREKIQGPTIEILQSGDRAGPGEEVREPPLL